MDDLADDGTTIKELYHSRDSLRGIERYMDRGLAEELQVIYIDYVGVSSAQSQAIHPD